MPTAVKIVLAAVSVLLLAAAAVVLVFILYDPSAKPYRQAEEMFENGDFGNAAFAFEELGDYKDAPERAAESRNEDDYERAEKLLNEGNPKEALSVFEKLGSFKDSPARAEEAKKHIAYNEADGLIASGKFREAIEAFEALGSFKDSPARVVEAKDGIYNSAETALRDGNYETAAEEFMFLGSYRNAADRIEEVWEAKRESDYNAAAALFADGKYKEAQAAFEALGDYRDSRARANEAYEQSLFTTLRVTSMPKFTYTGTAPRAPFNFTAKFVLVDGYGKTVEFDPNNGSSWFANATYVIDETHYAYSNGSGDVRKSEVVLLVNGVRRTLVFEPGAVFNVKITPSGGYNLT
jgi:tetratricopeptide (TPR) repeat protein